MPPKKCNKGGYHNRFESTTNQEINDSPSVLFNFQEVECLNFCQKVQEVTNHPPLTQLFALRLQGEHVQIASLDFVLTPRSVSKATKIPYLGEKWFKQAYLDLDHYKPFLKLEHQDACQAIFPFSHLLSSYAPLMRIIMKYFTCEGRYSHLFLSHQASHAFHKNSNAESPFLPLQKHRQDVLPCPKETSCSAKG